MATSSSQSVTLTIAQDLGIFETIAGNIVAFAGGQVESFGPTTFDGVTISGSVQVLPNGPSAPFIVFTGSVWQILTLVLQSATEIAAGAPLSLAAKVKNTWYGLTFTIKV